MNRINFSEEEMMATGQYKSYFGPTCFTYDKLNTPITPKENLIRAVKRSNPLWIPMKSDEMIFCPRIIPDNIARAFVYEAQPFNGEVGGKDMFGIEWVFVPEVGGSMVRPGKPALTDIEDWKDKITFPNIQEWEWENNAKENSAYVKDDRFIMSWIFSGLFERLISWLDFENAAVALIDEEQQDTVHEIFQALVDLYKQIIFNLKKYYNIDGIFFHDDWGGQKSPFFSTEICRTMIAPYLKQLADYSHELDLVFELHCCGKVEALVPVMVECGVDKWAGQPLNDKEKLISLYGDKLLIGTPDSLMDTIDQNSVSEEELKEKMENYFKIYAKKAPENLFFLQNNMPSTEVIRAFYRAGRIRLSE